MSNKDILSAIATDITFQGFFQVTAPSDWGFEWYDKTGNLTYDKTLLDRKVKIEIKRTRLAEDEKDFDTIYQRERLKNPAGDEATFNEWLIRHVNRGLAHHIEQIEVLGKGQADLGSQTAARNFIKWVAGKQQPYVAGAELGSNKTIAEIFQRCLLNKGKQPPAYRAICYIQDFLYQSKEAGEEAVITDRSATRIAKLYGMKSDSNRTQLYNMSLEYSKGQNKIKLKAMAIAKEFLLNTGKLKSAELAANRITALLAR